MTVLPGNDHFSTQSTDFEYGAQVNFHSKTQQQSVHVVTLLQKESN